MRSLPDYQAAVLSRDCLILETLHEAMAAPDAGGWNDAVDREMNNFASYDAHELVPPALGMRTLCWMVLHRKCKNGSFEKNKARLVTRRDQQCPGIDYGNSTSDIEEMGPRWGGEVPTSRSILWVVRTARTQCYSFAFAERTQTDVIRLGDKGPGRVEFSRQIRIDPC